jgi:organic radical activating enzyme
MVDYPPLPEPLRVEFELTNHCNACCEFCPRFNIKEYGLMNLERFSQNIKKLKIAKQEMWLTKNYPFFNFPTIVFGGYGESLLHPQVFEFIAFAKKEGFKTELITNGKLLSLENCNKIIQSGLDQLSISLHTLDNDLNEKIMRIKDTLPIITQALDFLDDKEIRIEIWRVAKLNGELYDDSDYSSFLSKYSKKIPVLGPTPAWNRGGQFDSSYYGIVEDSKDIRCKTAYFTINFSFNGDVILCCCDFSTKKMILSEKWDFDYLKCQQARLRAIKNPYEMCNKCRKPKDRLYEILVDSLKKD